MQMKISSSKLSASILSRSRISNLMLSMLATMASIYVAGRLWQDAQNRVYLTEELDKITGQGKSAISVDDTLKIISCREQLKRLASLEKDLAAAKREGFLAKYSAERDEMQLKKGPVIVIGIFTTFGNKNKRDAIRKAWMSTGAALKNMEKEKRVIIRFVIGRSSNNGDISDREIDNENKEFNDFIILENHVEAIEEISTKVKLFFADCAEKLDAEFYGKVDDDVYVNTDLLRSTLEEYVDRPRAYIGCMKSGEVFSEQGKKWYEPEWWKFGDGKRYFRHASGEMFILSRALAKFISINRSILRNYVHDDVSVGSWFIGADVQHVDDKKFCCSSWSSGSGTICSGV